jgi:RNA polymerase sigma factor (sigma-70 family)
VSTHPGETEAPSTLGEPLSFEDFYLAERPGLFGAIVMVTRSTTEAEELVQEAFVRLWERWDQVSAHPDPHGYLYRTAFNLDRQRRRRLRRAAARLVAASDEPDAFDRADDLTALAAALGELSRRRRTAVVLMDLLGFDSDDAAELMGNRPATVRSLASQGRAELRRSMGGRHE